jgi:hypothetical protein
MESGEQPGNPHSQLNFTVRRGTRINSRGSSSLQFSSRLGDSDLDNASAVAFKIPDAEVRFRSGDRLKSRSDDGMLAVLG